VSTSLKVIVTLVAGAIGTAFAYLYADLPMATYMHEHGTSVTSDVGRFLEELGKSHWFLIANAVIIVATWRASRKTAYDHIVLFGSIALSGIIANAIKVCVNRARPPLYFSEGIFGFEPLTFATDFLHTSFPSGHATTGLALAVAGTLTRPRGGWIFVPVGLAIALGRIPYNVHYVSDVVAGATIGAATAIVVASFIDGRRS